MKPTDPRDDEEEGEVRPDPPGGDVVRPIEEPNSPPPSTSATAPMER